MTGSFAACKTALAAAAIVLSGGTLAYAQQVACSGAPGPPENMVAKVDGSIKATSKVPFFTPAVLNLSWEESSVDSGHPDNVPDAYVIEAGSDRGLTDIALVRTAGPELDFSTPMANGTYYIRVRSENACGMSQPSRESRVRIHDSVEKGRPNPLVILSTVRATRERSGNGAYVRVMGQVRNGWEAAPAPFVKVTANFEGARGALGVTRTAYVNGTSRRLKLSHIVTDTVIEPGMTGCFLVFAQFPSLNVTGLGLFASADDFDAEPLHGRVEMDGQMALKADDFGDMQASGHLKNTGDRPTRFNEIWVEARDGAGQLADCHATSVHGSNITVDNGLTTRTSLQPAQSGDFASNTEAVFAMVHTIRQWITWDESDVQETPALTRQYHVLQDHLVALVEGDEQATSPQEVAELRDALRSEIRSIEQGLAAAPRR